jgi:hypothetical protein
VLKAVQFDSYGGVDVLEVRRPVAGAGEVLVDVRAARWHLKPRSSVPRPAADPSDTEAQWRRVGGHFFSGGDPFAAGVFMPG